LTVNNTNGITIPDGDLSVSTGVTPTFTMTAGNINTRSNALTLAASTIAAGTYTYTAGTIIGKLKKWINTTKVDVRKFIPWCLCD